MRADIRSKIEVTCRVDYGKLPSSWTVPMQFVADFLQLISSTWIDLGPTKKSQLLSTLGEHVRGNELLKQLLAHKKIHHE